MYQPVKSHRPRAEPANRPPHPGRGPQHQAAILDA